VKDTTVLIPFTVTEWRLIAVALFIASRTRNPEKLAYAATDVNELLAFAKKIATETGKYSVDGRKL
jgi:hypothetical protein